MSSWGAEADRTSTRLGPAARERGSDVAAARLRVNPITCEGHGLCAELLPELIRLDDWGYPILDSPDVPPELVRLARRAADACPTLALILEERQRG
jgi:ferredoxin